MLQSSVCPELSFTTYSNLLSHLIRNRSHMMRGCSEQRCASDLPVKSITMATNMAHYLCISHCSKQACWAAQWRNPGASLSSAYSYYVSPYVLLKTTELQCPLFPCTPSPLSAHIPSAGVWPVAAAALTPHCICLAQLPILRALPVQLPHSHGLISLAKSKCFGLPCLCTH